MKANEIMQTLFTLALQDREFNPNGDCCKEGDPEKEIKKLDDFANEMAAPYKANLFANQEYCDVIMNAVTEAKKALQNTQVKLDKERNYYQ